MKTPDIKKIDLLLQYILAVAGRDDDPWNRELGMIHLIKHAYLADLSYAERNKGETYTGLPWKFHHLGPWSVELYHRIEPALLAIGARQRMIPNPKDEKDFARWSIEDDHLIEKLEGQIDLVVMGSVQQSVRRFGSDTKSLLNFVYQTRPMLRAAPEELLDFIPPESIDSDTGQVEVADSSKALTARQQKKRKEKILALKKRIAERLDSEIKETKIPPTPPRYDDVFFEGVENLNSMMTQPMSPMELSAHIASDMWKSKARFDEDVS